MDPLDADCIPFLRPFDGSDILDFGAWTGRWPTVSGDPLAAILDLALGPYSGVNVGHAVMEGRADGAQGSAHPVDFIRLGPPDRILECRGFQDPGFHDW